MVTVSQRRRRKSRLDLGCPDMGVVHFSEQSEAIFGFNEAFASRRSGMVCFRRPKRFGGLYA